MFAHNTSVDNHAFQSFFAVGDCLGHLCRFPLDTLLQHLPVLTSALSSRADDTVDCFPPNDPQLASLPTNTGPSPAPQWDSLAPSALPQQFYSNVPFAIAQEWQNKVWHYQVSLHSAQESRCLHEHLAQDCLTSIPEQEKAQLQHWVYFASSLDQLKQQLTWQPLTQEQRQLQRIHHLYDWLQLRVQQASLIEQLLILPLTDLPFGEGLNRNVATSLARVSKLSLPNRDRLPALNYALVRNGRLQEGYGLHPNHLGLLTAALQDKSDQEETFLVLDQTQCLKLLQQLEGYCQR